MSNLQYRQLKLRNSLNLADDNLNAIRNALMQLERGVDVNITFQVEGSRIKKLRQVYFSMVTELAKFAGYMSNEEREEFKDQIKTELKVNSISEITDCDEMSIIIESLHQLASRHYNYLFKPNDPGLFSAADFKSSGSS